MICPKCGGSCLVKDVVQNPDENETYRKRVCKVCNHTFYSTEFVVDQNKDFLDTWSECYVVHRVKYIRKRDKKDEN